MICSVNGCGQIVNCKNLCKKHYTQLRRTGKVMDRTLFDKNDIVINQGYAEIILYSRRLEENGRAIVDIESLPLLKKFKWGLTHDGYVKTASRRNGNILMHRMLLSPSKSEFVDHINHDKCDNRMSNLRICSPSQNLMNMQSRINNTSGHIGVSYDSSNNLYVASIQVNGARIRERFKTINEAIERRKQMELEHFKEFRYGGQNENRTNK